MDKNINIKIPLPAIIEKSEKSNGGATDFETTVAADVKTE